MPVQAGDALKIAAAVLAAAGTLFAAYYVGWDKGSKRQEDRLQFVAEQRDDCRREVEKLLQRTEEKYPSAVEPAPGVGPAAKDWTATLTRGVVMPIGDTGYTVEVEDIRPSDEGGHIVTVAVTYRGTPQRDEIATSGMRVINGIAVQVVSADVAQAHLKLALPEN